MRSRRMRSLGWARRAAGAVAAAAWLAGTLAGAPGGAAAQSAARPFFTWVVQERFVPDTHGRLPEVQPEDVRRGPRELILTVVPELCREDGTYRWTLNGRPIHPKLTVGCRFEATVPRPGTYDLGLRVDGERRPDRQRLLVRDLVIVSIGDSIGSGEANPDVANTRRATWNSARCHRSGKASPAVAARAIERDDPHSSVTFVHLACSGATVHDGLRGPYQGAEPPPNEGPLPRQIDRLEDVDRREPIDAVILNVGANDVQFGPVTTFCVTARPDCFEKPFRGSRTAAQVVADELAALPGRYARLARDLRRSVAPGQVHVVEYFDPTTDRHGKTCARILRGVTKAELGRARTELLTPLNAIIASTRATLGWRVVEGVAERYSGHGYCAGKDSWVTTLTQSLASLGGRLDGRLKGTLHPNAQGQRRTADLVAADLAQSLLHRELTAEPEASDSEAGPRKLRALEILAYAVGALLFVMAVAWLVERQSRRLKTIAAGLLGLAGAAALGSALFAGLDAGVERGVAIAGGVLLGAAVVVRRLASVTGPRTFDAKRVTILSAAATAVALTVALVALAGAGGGRVVAGLVVGIALARLTTLRADDPGPFRSAAPVALPVLAILAVGTVEMAWWIPPIAGLLTGFAGTALIVAPELRGELAQLEWVLDKAKQLAVVALMGAVFVLVASKLLSQQLAWFEDRGGVPVALLVAALCLWVLTIVLRLVSYATTRQRLIVGTALLLLTLRGLAEVGVIPGYDALRKHVPALDTAAIVACAGVVVLGTLYPDRRRRVQIVTAALLLVALGLMALGVLPGKQFARGGVGTVLVVVCATVVLVGPVFELLGRRVQEGAAGGWLARPLLAREASRVAAGLGLGTALLASVLVAGAAIAGMLYGEDVGSNKLPAGARGVRAEVPREVVPADDAKLADTYSPVLAFTRGERWAPVDFESYLASKPSATRLERDGRADESPRMPLDLVRACPSRDGACWRLTIRCPEGKRRCSGHRRRPRGRFERSGTVYERVVRRDRPTPDGGPDPFASLPPYLAEQNLTALVQYWYFYRYDEWKAPVLPGSLVQRHEGDWEAVMVGVAPDRPLFVAYSAHCGGAWRWWKDARVSPLTSPWVHPLVAVAEGSHANYPHAGAQSPNWTSCAGLPDGMEAALTYAANVRERTDYAWQWYPARRSLARADALPMSFPGRWGLNDRSVLANFAHHPTSRSGKGPKTPTLQPLWIDPLRTVFCNQYWDGPVRLRC